MVPWLGPCTQTAVTNQDARATSRAGVTGRNALLIRHELDRGYCPLKGEALNTHPTLIWVRGRQIDPRPLRPSG